MSKYKTGDKVVLEIIQDDSYGDYKVGNKTYSWWNSHELLDNGSVPLSKYIKSMEEKLHNQRVEINRLLEENKELKINANWCDNCAKADSIDEARVAGQEEAWKLAQKIWSTPIDGGFNPRELIEIFGAVPASSIFSLNTYTEAATKVAEWEKAKEEICVGDVVSIKNINICGIVTHKDTTDNTMNVIASNGSTIFVEKEDCTKTGRHIDINALLKQIGGESE